MDLALYEKMSVDERAELDAATKRKIVEAIVGRSVLVVENVHDPLAVGWAMLRADNPALPLPRLEPDERSEQFFHDRRRTAQRPRR